jgi:glycosyltransferase involved in cell wall biosynthesis
VPALERLRSELPDRIVADGFVPKDEYRSIVAKVGIVVSTAAHEFQGLSVLEAVSAGAIPVVPDALCYPEQYPEEFRYRSGDVAQLTNRLEAMLSSSDTRTSDMAKFFGTHLLAAWRRVLMQ